MSAVGSIKAGATIVPPASAAEAAVADRPAAAKTESTVSSADVRLNLRLEENRELLGEFYGEAVEHLQQIEAALLALEQQPDNPEALNSIFRSFHTIKGNAGFLGLVPMQALAHEVESLLDLARNNKLRLNSAIVTEILRSRDALQTLNQQVARALETGALPDEIVPVGHLIEAVKKLAFPDGSTEAKVEKAVVSAPVTVSIPEPAKAAVVEHVVAPSSEAVPTGPKAAPTRLREREEHGRAQPCGSIPRSWTPSWMSSASS